MLTFSSAQNKYVIRRPLNSATPFGTKLQLWRPKYTASLAVLLWPVSLLPIVHNMFAHLTSAFLKGIEGGRETVEFGVEAKPDTLFTPSTQPGLDSVRSLSAALSPPPIASSQESSGSKKLSKKAKKRIAKYGAKPSPAPASRTPADEAAEILRAYQRNDVEWLEAKLEAVKLEGASSLAKPKVAPVEVATKAVESQQDVAVPIGEFEEEQQLGNCADWATLTESRPQHARLQQIKATGRPLAAQKSPEPSSLNLSLTCDSFSDVAWMENSIRSSPSTVPIGLNTSTDPMGRYATEALQRPFSSHLTLEADVESD